MSPSRSASADTYTITVDDGLCKGCGICAHACPTDVFEMQSTDVGTRPVATDIEACIGCLNCEMICPDFALDIGGTD